MCLLKLISFSVHMVSLPFVVGTFFVLLCFAHNQHFFFLWTQVLPLDAESMKAQEQDIEAAKLAALEASTADDEFVPENVPEHLVQPDQA